jgi:Zn-dependent protease
MPTRRGSFRIFRLLGIDVYLHYSWFIFALLRFEFLHFREYNSPIWYVVEYVALFAIVLMHEFGHALACKQVGGTANQIVLWPLGGVAYVSPPQRPGAMLWSIAAGPLVNVALLPVFATFCYCSYILGWSNSFHDLHLFLWTLLEIDVGLLIFNMLPFYPLDGGQILRSLLWFMFGRANSLMIAAIVGFIGVAGLGLFAAFSLFVGDSASAVWIGILVLFMGLNCWGSLRFALALSKLEKSPRRTEFACPVCREPPPAGDFWRCSRCRKAFDTFLSQSFCPHCNTEYPVTGCPFCHSHRPLAEWRAFQTPAVPPSPQ